MLAKLFLFEEQKGQSAAWAQSWVGWVEWVEWVEWVLWVSAGTIYLYGSAKCKTATTRTTSRPLPILPILPILPTTPTTQISCQKGLGLASIKKFGWMEHTWRIFHSAE